MIAVIQCAARKKPDASYFRRQDGMRVLFVADPALAPESPRTVYARPDDRSSDGPSWREVLLRYNDDPTHNPLGLYRAADLYQNAAYGHLAARFGIDKMYVLSAGWGLIGASFLTPQYDITFTQAVKKTAPWKFRRRNDRYDDLCQLPSDTDEPIVFFGCKEYLPLFYRLTQAVRAPKTVFHKSAVPPSFPGIIAIPYYTNLSTNWHYACVKDFLTGSIGLGGGGGASPFGHAFRH